MSASDIAISVRDLGKSYTIAHNAEKHVTLAESLLHRLRNPFRRAERETFWALKDVSFDVKKGDVVGIIGRNGAGKSTLLKVLSRITEPTTGEIDLYGRVGSLLEVGTGFHPELTGRENIFLNGAILGMNKAEIRKQFDAIVDFSGVEKFLDTPVKRYSSGMYVRLAFAVAAHLRSEILVVDEVLAVGDAEFQKKCLGKIKDVASSGRTVLFVSHSMATVTRLCTRALLLHGGQLLFEGLSQEAVAHYMNSGLAKTSERVWKIGEKSPGDTVARLRAVRVVDGTGVPVATVDIRRDCFIEIDYEHLSSERRHRPTAVFQLLNEAGTVLFSSADFNNVSWRDGLRRPGVVRSICRIPGNFLAEGRFNILAAVVSYNPDVVHGIECDAVSFHVIDRSEGDGSRGPCAQPWPGEVRPMLDWDVTYAETHYKLPAAQIDKEIPVAAVD